ncbi:MAG: bifunctional diaminohydroxyphosphoribosylaminopyrimidine [Bacteroidota bacterium]|jgi:diaminohydroxyphosphoribosylaminopyrimidine deaminase/5-amino-6-(5-phosphoribosylamino)uracil reductase
MNHQFYMQQCIDLALKGIGNVAPNPMVGAVLVHDDKIIGEGWHRQYGEAHAEVNCINSVAANHQHLIAESTLYVNLEPCNHTGKTPPCTDFILQHGIKKIVVGCVDANPLVGGKGIAKLKTNNCHVVYPILEKENIELNKRFFTFHQKKRPYIFLKYAQTKDRFIAADNYNAIKISNNLVDEKMHEMRSHEAAIMVGYNTAWHDNPRLTARLTNSTHQPLRIVIDRQNKLPVSHHLLSDKLATLILNEVVNKHENNKEYLRLDFNYLLPHLMNELYKRNINSMIVEGGAILLQNFINENLWDEAIVITNTELSIHHGIDAPILIAKPNTSITAENNCINYFRNTNTI